jgi:predicted Zn-dependent peptidase
MSFISLENIREFSLDNGAKCILYKDARNPIVNIHIGYDVGSKNDPSKKKGLAHLFEHLMFQGSENIKKNEHFSFIQNNGGVCNAYTSFDNTIYFESLPAHKLGLALWLESDRMLSLDLSEENLLNQKKVVIEEKHSNYDNVPYGTAMRNIFNTVFENSVYESPVIGNEDNIESVTVDDAVGFHSKFYSPQNSVIVISGSIDLLDTENSVKEYFDRIENKGEPFFTGTEFRKLNENNKSVIYDNISLPALYLCFQIPQLGSDSEFTLEFFSDIIINNKNSRLYKKLVYEKKILQSISALKYNLKYSGVFIIAAYANPGINLDSIQDEILNEIKNIYAKGITDDEYNKVKNAIEFENLQNYYNLHTMSANLVHGWLFFNDYFRFFSNYEKYMKICKDEIMRDIYEYFLTKNYFALHYLPNR